ncbi:MAG: hypothetical protein CMN27_09040 [Salinisphaera sp.]|nr:hypothetical protein [Salinisphaera sp.]
MKKALKGPQVVTAQELKDQALESLINIKAYLIFYAATPLVLWAQFFLRSILFLICVGKGKAVGGISVIVSTIGVILSFYA